MLVLYTFLFYTNNSSGLCGSIQIWFSGSSNSGCTNQRNNFIKLYFMSDYLMPTLLPFHFGNLNCIKSKLPVLMNITSYALPSRAWTLSTTIRLSRAPVLTSTGFPFIGRTASSMRGRSLINCNVLSGRSRERLKPILRATLLMHWNIHTHMFTVEQCSHLDLLHLCRLTPPGLGTGTSPVYITHFTWDVSTATGVLNFPSLKMVLMSDTLYAHTADTWDKLLLKTQLVEQAASFLQCSCLRYSIVKPNTMSFTYDCGVKTA